jgi:hypothetical protein
MLMIIAFLVVYFALLNRMKQIVEINREYHKAIQKNNNHKNNIQQQAIDEVQWNYQSDYIYLFDHVQ